MRGPSYLLVALLGLACTDGERHPWPEPKQSAAAKAPEPEPEPEPKPKPWRESPTEGEGEALIEGLWAMALHEYGEAGFVVRYVPMYATRELLDEGRTSRWRYAPPQPDGQSLTISITVSELPHPSSLDEARARLEQTELEWLAAKEISRGYAFVRADPQRTELFVDGFLSLDEHAIACSARWWSDAPLPKFDAARERLEGACTGVWVRSNDPIELGTRGLLGAPDP